MNIPSWSTSPFWGTFWGQLLGDILGAFVFLFLILLLLRPKVRIAPFLCKISDNYHFKFVNVSILMHTISRPNYMRFEKFLWAMVILITLIEN